MNEPNFVAGKECLDFVSTVESIIRRSCIVDFGIVQSVPSDGLVNVSVAVANTEQDMQIMTCVLANIAGESFTFNVVPKEGDRVLVVYPRMYDDKMFTLPEGDERLKVIVNPKASGYNLCSGIAILLNQYKTARHHNYVKINNGTLDLKMAYDKDSEKNLFEFKTTNKGEFTLKSNDVEISADKDNEITIDNGKATITVDKNGNVSVDSKGKYTVKNTTTDLSTVISSLADLMKNLVIVCPNGAGSVDPSSATLIEKWKLEQLKALFAS
jgi:hypothetical protein